MYVLHRMVCDRMLVQELDELREELDEQKEELRRAALTHEQRLEEMRSYRDETSDRLRKLGIADLVGADVDMTMPRLVNLSQGASIPPVALVSGSW